jgi:hypothetical protein
LTLEDGTELAVLNDHACKTLDRLVERRDICLEALTHTASLHERIGQMTTPAEARFRVDIYIYGSPESSAEIESSLSAQKIYLQRPDYKKPGTQYDNPQVLKFPGMEMSTTRHAVQSNTNSKLARTTGDEFRKEVSGLYASLKRSDNLKRMETDRRVTTTLLP